MPRIGTGPHFTRRTAMRAAGLTAGLAAAPFGASCGAPYPPSPRDQTQQASTGTPLDVLVLLPRSSLYPSAGAGLLAGMRLYLEHAGGGPLRLRAHRLETGSVLVGQQVERLLQQSGARVVVGMLNTRIAAQLQGVLDAARAVFVNTSVGENMQRAGDVRPNIFHISLAQWQANWALGEHAARTLGRKAWLATSFYESGYDALHAFRLGFEEGGGAVVGTSISHLPSRAPDARRLEETVAQITAARPDVVFAGYSGPAAAEFLHAYHDSPLHGRTPLAGSSFLMEARFLVEEGTPAAAAVSGLGWDEASVRQDAPAFCAAYETRTGCSVDPFATLGFEAADLICQAIDASGGDFRRAVDLRPALASAVLSSPRGHVTMDSRTHTTLAPLYLRQLRWEAGAMHSVAIGTRAPISEQDPRVEQWRASHKTGWLNAYLQE